MRKFLFFVFTASCAVPALSSAEVRLADYKVSVQKKGDLEKLRRTVINTVSQGIMSHVSEDTSAFDQYVECAEVLEIPSAFICQSHFQKPMNAMFTRMGFFMGAGKGTKEGEVLPKADQQLLNFEKLISGHNLSGKSILGFYDATSGLGSADAKSLRAEELSFKKGFVENERVRKLGTAIYVISVSAQNTKSAHDLISHEIYHAQYGLSQKYKSVVEKFWKEEISLKDKEKIRKILGSVYNEADSIIIDEFQAYLLQTNAQGDQLGEFVGKYGAKLKQKLKAGGTPPVSVN